MREQIVDLLIFLPRGARTLGKRLTFAVFSREQTLREGRKDGHTHAVLRAYAEHFVLDVAVSHVVLRLNDRERAQVQFLNGGKRLRKLHGRPFRNAVI